MKQKIIIEFSTQCGKCRTTALKIAAEAEGVTQVALHGPEKNKLQIIGEDVDAVHLTKRLRKKLCHAKLESVEEVKEEVKKEVQKEVQKEEKPAGPAPPQYICCPGPGPGPGPAQPSFEIIRLDPAPTPCTIM